MGATLGCVVPVFSYCAGAQAWWRSQYFVEAVGLCLVGVQLVESQAPFRAPNSRPIWLWMAMVLPMLAVGITIAAASPWTFEGIVALREADPKTADIEELRSEAITAFLTRVTAITGIYAALAGLFGILSHVDLYDNKPLDLVSKSLAFGAAAYLAVYSLMAALGS